MVLLWVKEDCVNDIVFLLDRSGSIEESNREGQPANWDLMIDFTKSVIDQADVGPDEEESQFGAVLFGNRAYIQFYLDSYQTADDLKDAMDKVQYRAENTNTTGGLWVTRTMLFDSLNGNRDDVDDVVVLVTDGIPTREVESLPDEIDNYRNAGITIIAIGVGEADAEFLETIAESEQYYYYLPDFQSLTGLAQVVTQTICGQIVTVPTESTTEPPTVTTPTTTATPSAETSGTCESRNKLRNLLF